jgi:Methyltransferase domain
MDHIHGGVVRRFRSEPRVVVHRLPSLGAATIFADATFDWIYVDGDHSYEAVKSDLTAWFAKLMVGGWLAGDDYDWRDEKGDLSVKRAVDEFISEHGLAPADVQNGQYVVPR